MSAMQWLAWGSMLAAPFALCAQEQPVTTSAASQFIPVDKYKLSYAIGYRTGWQLSSGEFASDVDMVVVLKGIEDAYAKRVPAVPKQAMYQQLVGLGEQMHDKAVSQFDEIAAENARSSAQFMKRNAAQSGVVQLPSGIQYRVIRKGTGAISPNDQSVVTINYRAMLVDGTEFDNTWSQGRPVHFTVNSVIAGWRYVLPLMHVGDRWRVVVPPLLAFGQEGLLPRIGPNQALVFDLELLDVRAPH